MVVTLYGLPHPVPHRIIAVADRKKPASIPLVGTTLSAFLPISFLPYSLSKEPRIDRHRGHTVYAATETGLYALQSPSGEFRDPFASSAKPCQRLLVPFSTRCKALSTTVEPILQQVQSPVNNRWIHSTGDAVPCQQPLKPLNIA